MDVNLSKLQEIVEDDSHADGWEEFYSKRLKGHEFEPTLGDSEGQGSLACCSPGVTKSQAGLSD